MHLIYIQQSPLTYSIFRTSATPFSSFVAVKYLACFLIVSNEFPIATEFGVTSNIEISFSPSPIVIISSVSKFKYLPSNGLKGFFYYKFIEAEKRGIKVSLNISKLVENSYLGDMKTKDFKDLTRIIGVYLDNAIEAASTSKDKKLGIEIYEVKGIIQIIISNTYDNAIEKDKVGNERYSTKGKNRGHGLLLVKRILNENNRITSETKITDSLYIQTIKINEK